MRERIKFGCQLTNCLPEKKIVQEIKKSGDEEQKNKEEKIESNPIIEKKNIIFEEPSQEIKEESIKNTNNDEKNSNAVNSYQESVKNGNSEKEITENNTNKALLSNDLPKSAEIMYENELKENDEQNYDEGTNLEVLDHRSKSMDQQLIFEREEKNMKCQYCKECIIY